MLHSIENLTKYEQADSNATLLGDTALVRGARQAAHKTRQPEQQSLGTTKVGKSLLVQQDGAEVADAATKRTHSKLTLRTTVHQCLHSNRQSVEQDRAY